jgi:peptidoglycan/xylan/chitin deacetylase (PgdA/CDA1 family)
MQKAFYKFSRYSDFVPLKFLKVLTGVNSIFPFYHVISDDDVVHIKHLYKIQTVNNFKKDLEFLLKNYDPIDPNELISASRNGSDIQRNGFLLTFDDGLSEFYDIIAPILRQKGIPAICFLNSGFIDNKDLFYRYKVSLLIERLNKSSVSLSAGKSLQEYLLSHNMPYDESGNFLYLINYLNRNFLDEIARILEVDFGKYLSEHKPYLETREIKELIKQGFLFGSHSIDHPRYADLTLDQQIFQTESSVQKIVLDFGLEYKLFSFPFTDFGISKNLFEALHHDKESIVDLSFGCAGLKKDECRKNIQRIPFEVEGFSAREILYGEYFYYLAKGILGKNRIIR